VLKLDEETAKLLEHTSDSLLSNWSQLWIVDPDDPAKAPAVEPVWPTGTWEKWKLWEFGDVDLKSLGTFKGSRFNGSDENLRRFFVGEPPEMV